MQYYKTQGVFLLIIVMMVVFAYSAFAQGQVITQAKPGITPDKLRYVVDTFGEWIGLKIRISAEKRYIKALDYANEKLAEAEMMLGKKSDKYIAKALKRYTVLSGYAERASLQLTGDALDTALHVIREKTLRQSDLLTRLYEVATGVNRETIKVSMHAIGLQRSTMLNGLMERQDALAGISRRPTTLHDLALSECQGDIELHKQLCQEFDDWEVTVRVLLENISDQTEERFTETIRGPGICVPTSTISSPRDVDNGSIIMTSDSGIDTIYDITCVTVCSGWSCPL